MENTIVTYTNLSSLAKENAIRYTRNSIAYSNHILHELNARAEGLFYRELGFDTDVDVAEIFVSFKKHCVDFSAIPEGNRLFDFLNISLSIATQARLDNFSEQVVEQTKIRSPFEVDADILGKVADVEVVYANGEILCHVESFADVELSIEEKLKVESWMQDSFRLHIGDIREELVAFLRELYTVKKIDEYLTKRNPEYLSDGRILNG